MGIEILTGFIYSLIVYNIPLLYGTVGEIFNERTGSLNLGVEGTMAVGALFGYLIGCWTNSLFLGILASMIFAGLCGLLFAFFTVTLQANQNVTGLTITTFGLGVYYFVGHGVNKGLGWPSMQAATNVAAGWKSIHIPFFDCRFILVVYEIYKGRTSYASNRRKSCGGGFLWCEYQPLQIFPYHSRFCNHGYRWILYGTEYQRRIFGKYGMDKRLWLDCRGTCHFCKMESDACSAWYVYIRNL